MVTLVYPEQVGLPEHLDTQALAVSQELMAHRGSVDSLALVVPPADQATLAYPEQLVKQAPVVTPVSLVYQVSTVSARQVSVVTPASAVSLVALDTQVNLAQ